jgi:competence protein ComEA
MTFALAVLLIALVTSNQTQPVANPFPFQSSEASPATDAALVAETQALEQKLMVHVVGEVKDPGVYELASGARVLDAVAAAGGFTKGADQTSIHLVRPISDGEQLVVFKCGSPNCNQVTSAGGSGTGSANTKVNVNTGSASQLDSLPGIGPTLAGRIVDYRNSNGGFKSVSDLGRVSGIGPKLLAQIANLVTL